MNKTRLRDWLFYGNFYVGFDQAKRMAKFNKKTGILILSAALILGGCSLFKNNKITPYAFDSAIIQIAQTGNIEGTTTIYIKGDKSLRETHAIKRTLAYDSENHESSATQETQQPKTEEKIDTLYLSLGEKVYQIDLNSKTGYSGPNPFYTDLKKTSPEKRMENITKSFLGINSENQQLPKPLEQKIIAGQKCDLYRIQDITDLCIWNGIPIYEKTVFPELAIDSMSSATSIETNIDIPDSKFELPAGITIK